MVRMWSAVGVQLIELIGGEWGGSSCPILMSEPRLQPALPPQHDHHLNSTATSPFAQTPTHNPIPTTLYPLPTTYYPLPSTLYPLPLYHLPSTHPHQHPFEPDRNPTPTPPILG